MDPIAIQILEEGWQKDAEVLAKIHGLMQARLSESTDGRWAATAYELNRFYNVLEKSFERLCETFENHFEKTGSYHERLIERMELPISGIRPAFLKPEALVAIRELKGFRHVFRHAYDLELNPLRIEALVLKSEICANAFPVWCKEFLQVVREQHGFFRPS